MRKMMLVTSVVLAACGGGGGGMTPDAAPAEAAAITEHTVAFEGQGAFVEALSVPGVDLTGAHVEVEAGSPLELVDSRCNAVRCGAVLRVRDTIPNRGVSVPAPIDTQNAFVVVVEASGTRHPGLVVVNPLDTITGAGSTPLTIGTPVLLAASADASAGSVFRGPVGDAPLRWVIFGDANLHGTLDLRAVELPIDVTARSGGHAGGVAGSAGEGAAGGAAGVSGAGAGGGGARLAGESGAGADGTASAGAAGGAARDELLGACLSDFAATGCGGGGGGGSESGAGGAGGGSALIVSLGTLDIAGAQIFASGMDGEDGGGGGGGGALLLAGAQIQGSAVLDVAGGGGGASLTGSGTGGGGGEGLLRVDGASSLAGASAGPSFDLTGFSPLVSARTVMLTGKAAPDAELSVSLLGEAPRVTTRSDTTGAFSVEVPLTPGLNRLSLSQLSGAESVRSWSGTSVELARLGSPLALPVGGALDIVSLPPDE